MEKKSKRRFGIKTKTIPLVSTLHVIEATRKAMMGHSLEEVYEETLNVNTFLEEERASSKTVSEIKEKLAIVAICTTGEGSAVAICIKSFFLFLYFLILYICSHFQRDLSV
ncbi:hypothetical protein [Thermoanaerobacter pentosaceus]|uniref:Transcriptional regulatory protein LevR n=1 Tax=Thermoanaerobacter pentosaceus TaxID=694059 RepID=A0ABT9M4W6_9THEO|nr:hypothetical protein [Thermoanaerobacter pentosaceus]MDP9751117.1 transcriptional regulatory protein LevR [Thermoanaerobacter pentosaceus]